MLGWEVTVSYEPLILYAARFLLRQERVIAAKIADDLLQHLRICFFTALSNWNPDKSASLSTYMTSFLGKAGASWVSQQISPIRVPEYLMTEQGRESASVRTQEVMLDRLRKSVLDETPLYLMGRPPDGHLPDFAEAAQRQPIRSMHRWRGEAGEGEQYEVDPVESIIDESIAAELAQVELLGMGKAIRRAMTVLNERERAVIEDRFGFKDDIAHTREEIGRKFGVTRERIRQIEAKALRKLRHPQFSRPLMDFLE